MERPHWLQPNTRTESFGETHQSSTSLVWPVTEERPYNKEHSMGHLRALDNYPLEYEQILKCNSLHQWDPKIIAEIY